MKISPKRIAALLGFSSLLLAMPARADVPALAWAEYRMDSTVGDCIDKTTQAMEKQGIKINPDYGRGIVAGNTDKVKVVTECFSVAQTTVVLIIVSGADENETINILTKLQEAIPHIKPSEFEL
jgi:hypothetical protein